MNKEEIAWARETFKIDATVPDEEVIKVVSTTYALAFHRANIAFKKLGDAIRKEFNINDKKNK